jgi:hypothetical protein
MQINISDGPGVIELEGGSIEYGILPSELQVNSDLYKELWDMRPDYPETMKRINTLIEVPRYTQAYGMNYATRFINHKAAPLDHPYLLNLLNWTKSNFYNMNGILLDWFSNGDHLWAIHPEAGKYSSKRITGDSPVYYIFYGQPRHFNIKTTKPISSVYKILTCDNSYILLTGSVLKKYKFEIPKTAVCYCPNSTICASIRSIATDYDCKTLHK